MKKLLITLSPFCVILFVTLWVSCGLTGVFVFFGVTLFLTAMIFLLIKWIEFVDKHIKD